MGDYHVMMQFEVEAAPGLVQRRLDSVEGISSWWSDTVVGSASAVGDRFDVSFPDAPAPFELEVGRIDPGGVEWRIDNTPEWWAGTTVRIETSEGPSGPDSTLVMFSHRDFEPDSPMIPIVTPVWAGVIGRLKAVVEDDTRRPMFVNG